MSSVSIYPQGAALATGSSLQFSVTCTYANGAQDDCTAAGGATWSSSSASYLSVSSSGMAKWFTDAGSNNPFALAHVIVSAGGISDRAEIMGQHVGDVFYQYPTPEYSSYVDGSSGARLPLNVVVGSTVTIGSGFVINQANPGWTGGNPFQMTCSWSSSNTSIASVDRHGQVTAIAPGTVDITCGRAGTAVYGQVNSSTWISPGNVITLSVVAAPTAANTTWYVRPDGGTPFVNTSQTPNGQCDGTHDAAYPGSGVNQPCALGDFNYLYFDQVSHLRSKWMISGGDTVIVRQKAGGYNPAIIQASIYSPTNCGDMQYCDVPSIPSGSMLRPTRILGENYGSCHGDSAKTLLNVWGRAGINVRGSQFVEVSCFEMTDKAACGAGAFSNSSCVPGNGVGTFGIVQSALTSQVSYNDLFVHGLAAEAIHGASGVGVVGNYLHIRAMPAAGIDMDDAPWLSSNISVAGGFTLNNSITEFTGCIEEYPVTHAYPYLECRDQNTGGYGDGFGTASTTGDWVFDHDIWRYNFQDGLDLLHSGMQHLSITNSQSYGNDGQAYKIGSADTVVFRNNTAVVNCNRITAVIGDEPAGAVVPGVAPCRGGGDWVPMNFTDQGTYLVQNNTLVGYGSVPFDLSCAVGWGICSHATAIAQNNIILGYSDPMSNGGNLPASFYPGSGSAMPANNGWSQHDHNLLFNVRSCPSNLGQGETCNTLNPKLLNQPNSPIPSETALDNFNFAPASSSPLIGAGTAVAGITTDILGNLRASVPTIGAIEVTGVGSAAITPPTPSITTLSLSATPVSAVAGANVTLSATASLANSLLPTGSVSFVAGSKLLGTASLSSGTATLNTSSLAAGTYAVTASYAGDSNFAAVSSNQTTLTINTANVLQPVLTAAVSPNPATPGQAVTFSASVTGANGLTPTGVINFLVNGKTVQAQLSGSGFASTSLASLAAGTYPVTATYLGDTNFNAASVPAGTLAVAATQTKVAAALTITATPNPATTNQPLTLTAAAPAVNGVTPTGTVSFTVNNTTLTAPLTGGAATVSMAALGAAGTYTVAATYSGDNNFNAASASPATVSVAVPASNVTVSIAQPATGFTSCPAL